MIDMVTQLSKVATQAQERVVSMRAVTFPQHFQMFLKIYLVILGVVKITNNEHHGGLTFDIILV